MTGGVRLSRAAVLLCATYFAVTVGRVIDGDTVDAVVKIYPTLTAQARVRVLGVDTPEKRGATMADALKAEAFTSQWLSADGPPVTVNACAFDAFGRLLGRVCRGSDCLDEALIRAGLGKPR